jgi:hypothetical protein
MVCPKQRNLQTNWERREEACSFSVKRVFNDLVPHHHRGSWANEHKFSVRRSSDGGILQLWECCNLEMSRHMKSSASSRQLLTLPLMGVLHMLLHAWWLFNFFFFLAASAHSSLLRSRLNDLGNVITGAF